MVIGMDGDEEVKMMVEREPGWSFREDRSYVIAGGLGGLGRSAARWMVWRGARNLILISRHGIVDELRTADSRTETLKCDVANKEALKDVLHCCSETMPPIAGCVQVSMVLRVKWPHHTLSLAVD